MEESNSSLAQAVQTNQISCLEISSNQLRELGGIESLANLLVQSTSVTQLDLRHLNIGPTEAKHVSTVIQYNTQLISVSI
jgi:hypothetical protein